METEALFIAKTTHYFTGIKFPKLIDKFYFQAMLQQNFSKEFAILVSE